MNIIDKVSERDGRITPVLELIERQREEGLHSGAVMYVSQRGRVLADVALGDLQPDSVVPWLSAGKPITAVAIGQLWERGLIDLDDPVARHLPEFAVKGKEQVTIRHLLTHTAGIRWAAIEKGMKWDEIVARVCEAPMEPSWPLGEKAGYHIYTSWFILGEIVRRVSGRMFHEYVRDEMFQPMGMSQAHFAQEHAWSPGAAARGTARELGMFYEMLLNKGASGANQILTPATVEELTRHHRVGMYDHTFKHTVDWGLGFIINSNQYGADTVPYGFGRHASPNTFGHGGRQCCSGFADPQHGLAVAVIFKGSPGEEAHQKRMRDVLSLLYESLGLA